MRAPCPYVFLVTASFFGSAKAVSQKQSVSFQERLTVSEGGTHNVEVVFTRPFAGSLSIHYCECETSSQAECLQQVAHLSQQDRDRVPIKLVWQVLGGGPSRGCLHAFSDSMLVGRSSSLTVKPREEKRWALDSNMMAEEGPSFDGTEYIRQKFSTMSAANLTLTASSTDVSIAIIGGGISGLMTAHLLDSIGLHNWKIIEASDRLGGRIYTSYLNGTRPEQYQYQELGPMHFPTSFALGKPSETIPIDDFRLVVQLADSLNSQNGNSSVYRVDFVDWVEHAQGEVHGGAATAKADGDEPDAVMEALIKWMNITNDEIHLVASNISEAYQTSISSGHSRFSLAGYLMYAMNYSAGSTDQVNDISQESSAWTAIYNYIYSQATTWRTIDQGFSKLANAFLPQVNNRTCFGTAVSGLAFNETSTTTRLEIRTRPMSSTLRIAEEDFDYVIVAVPFSKVRLWRLPEFSDLLRRAINRLNYTPACKVALHFRTRWWEHLEKQNATGPIYGGCTILDTRTPALGEICFPSYGTNTTAPGVLLASYTSGVGARSVGSMTAAEHVQHVMQGLSEVYGQHVMEEQFTGIYDRVCWEYERHQAGGWCDPSFGQQNLYLPAYFQTQRKTIFIGEHTSFTTGWVWSGLESAIRGVVQLLLELGHVDKAKEIVVAWEPRRTII